MQRPPMLILFDHGTPRSIARWLRGHTVVEAIARGWDRLANGAVLKAAAEAGVDLLLSTDKNIQYQQSLKGRRIAWDCRSAAGARKPPRRIAIPRAAFRRHPRG